MKKIFTAAAFIFGFNSYLSAQNLFSNPDFEVYSTCPVANGQMQYATGWIQVIESSDYVNCSYSGWTSQQIVGAQSGTGYAGFATYGTTLASEYTGQLLSAPLVAGGTYNISFYGKRTNGTSYGQICNGLCFYGWVGNPVIGAAQSGICPDQLPGYYFLGCSDTVISTLWQPYQVTFTAPAAIDFIAFGVGCTPGCGEYAYVDNMILQETTSIDEVQFNNATIIFPNPANDVIQIQNSFSNIESVEVYSLPGEKLIERKSLSQSETVLDVKNLRAGIYFLKIKSGNYSCCRKFIKE